MNLYSITSLLCAAFSFLLATFAFLAGKGKSYRLLMWFNIAVTFWGIGHFICATAASPEICRWGWKIADFGGFFIGALFYHLVTIVCNLKRRWLLIIAYAQSVFFNVLNFSTDQITSDTRNAFGFYFIKATPILTFVTLLYLFFVCLSYIELLRYSRIANKRSKRQVNFMIFGFMVGFLGGTSVLLPQFGIDIIYPVGNVGVFIYAGILTYAILKYNILDFEDLAHAAHRDKLAAIGTLATSINHEIRNPLYIIQGLAQSCLANVNEGVYASPAEAFERSKEVLSKVAEQAERAMSVMRGFAAFAKRGIHEEETCSERIPLNETLEGILPLVRHELELDKIELLNDVPEDLSPIQADKHHIEQIFFNLIVNACQAMKETGGKMAIEAAQHDGAIQIEVKDNGPGIAPSRLGQIFEPFYTTKEEGTGLGLYVTKQLVERNGGKISVKSKLGQGTTFALEFKR